MQVSSYLKNFQKRQNVSSFFVFAPAKWKFANTQFFSTHRGCAETQVNTSSLGQTLTFFSFLHKEKKKKKAEWQLIRRLLHKPEAWKAEVKIQRIHLMEQPFLVLTAKLKAISANYFLGISSVKGYGIYPEVGGLTGRCQGRCCKGITGSALLPGEKEESRWGGMLLSPLCMRL